MHGLYAVYDMDVKILVIIMTLMTPFIVEKDDGVVFLHTHVTQFLFNRP